MATNFEIILPRDGRSVTLGDGKTQKVFALDEIIEILERHKVKAYAIAPHPADNLSGFAHWHIGFTTASNGSYEMVARWFNLPRSSVQSIRTKFAPTYLLYLIHFNQEGKTPIDPDSVITSPAVDWDSMLSKFTKRAEDAAILDALASGDIREFELYSTQTPAWLRCHKREIDTALQVYAKTVTAKGGLHREMTVSYIYGDARTGKTSLAKLLSESSGLHGVYISSPGPHPFDDYQGQEVIIMDDLRASNFKFSDLLKILDPYTASRAPARYHDINLLCKRLFITTTQSLEDFYRDLQESNGEAVSQLRGRISELYHVTPSNVDLLTLRSDNLTYDPVAVFPNPTMSSEDIAKKTEAERRDMALQLVQGVVDVGQYVLKNMPELDDKK